MFLSVSDYLMICHITNTLIHNLRVDGNGLLKIADFGLSRDLYEGNYYKASTSRPLPIRWMAIECLANNAVFTIKSDVVSNLLS